MTKENPMRKIVIEKVTLNIGAGKDQTKLDKGIKLLQTISGVSPIKTTTQCRIQAWGLRPGLPIGAKVTLRGKKAIELLKRLIESRENIIPESCFDDNGNISFGVKEYIDVPGIKYDPSIGIIGFEVSVTMKRPGFRIKNRRILKRKIPLSHRISQEDAITFMKTEFGVKNDL